MKANSSISDGSIIKAKSIVLLSDVNVGRNSAVFADDIDLNGFTLSAVDGVVVAGTIRNGHISSTNNRSTGESTKLVVAAINVSSLKLLSVGRPGANGQDGQDGANGRAGNNGRNGRCDGFGRYRGAHAGGDGTAGQNGTDGTDGLDGVSGGEVFVITMNNRNSFDIDVSGRRGGFAGSGGRGGNGGVGGRGGSGCVGLGGSQTGKSSGRPGPNGRDGRSGNPGNTGASGKVFFNKLASMQKLVSEIPTTDEFEDYLPVMKKGLMGLASKGN